MRPHQKPRLEIKLESGHACIRRECLVCGESTDKDSLIAAVYEDGVFTRHAVCRSYPLRLGCLVAPPELLRERLRKRATTALAFASEMESLAADLPMMPTAEALQEAQARQRADEIDLMVAKGFNREALEDDTWFPRGNGQ